MRLDRALQRRMLELLREVYPGDTQDNFFDQFSDVEPDIDQWTGNFQYLVEHGLCAFDRSSMRGGKRIARITAKGLDFLEDDGGLSAILGVVTVRLHDDTVKQLIAERIEASDLPPADKRRWIEQLRSLPADATKHLVMRVLDLGLDQGWGALQAMLHNANLGF